MPRKSTYKKTGTFDYTQSKKDIKKKYKSDKETKAKVTESNVVNFVKNRLPKIAGMFATSAMTQQSSNPSSKTLTQTGSTMSKATGVIGQAVAKFAEQTQTLKGKGRGVKETIDTITKERESQFKKVGKIAPSVLSKCGSSRH